MTANFNVRKIYNTVKRMDSCEYSLKIIMVPLKERIAETNFFANEHTIVENIAQAMNDCKIFRQNKYSVL